MAYSESKRSTTDKSKFKIRRTCYERISLCKS